jgi:hypothetical protein
MNTDLSVHERFRVEIGREVSIQKFTYPSIARIDLFMTVDEASLLVDASERRIDRAVAAHAVGAGLYEASTPNKNAGRLRPQPAGESSLADDPRFT